MYKKMAKQWLSPLTLIVACAFVADTHAFGGYGGGSDPYDYSQTGTESVTSERGGRSCTVYRPATLSGDHPVILWGNGTGATPSSYGALLRHWASWGFVVVAANTTNAGTGEDMIACLNWLERSALAAGVNLRKVGTSGHSQGGGGSIMAGTDPRVTTTAPIEGYTLGLGHSRTSWPRQQGPMLLLSGSADTLVSPRVNHGPLFSQTNVPVFWAILQGASHFEPTRDGGGFREITTAWFLYQLKGNEHARDRFEGSTCAYCSDRSWEVQRKGI